MKVILVSPVFPYPNKGVYVGIERHIYEYSRALLKKGIDVNVITTFWNGGKEEDVYEDIKIYRALDSSLKHMKIGRIFNLHFYTFGRNVLRYKDILKSSDVVQSHMPLSSINFFKKHNIPIISYFYHKDEIQRLTDYLYMPIHFRLEKYAYSRSDTVIVPSNTSKNTLIEDYGIKRIRIRIIPFGVNDRFLNIKEKIQKKDDNGRFILLFVGPLIERKGLIYLIRAMPKVLRVYDNLQLVLVGEGKQRQTLVNEINKLNVKKHVKFTGYIDGWTNELMQYYTKADIFVFPSLKEGLPLAVLEALGCGKPVITTKTSSLPETVDDAGILVEPRNPEALADAIIRLIKDEDLRRELGRKGRKRVEENFTWDKVAEQTIKIYEEIIESRK